MDISALSSPSSSEYKPIPEIHHSSTSRKIKSMQRSHTHVEVIMISTASTTTTPTTTRTRSLFRSPAFSILLTLFVFNQEIHSSLQPRDLPTGKSSYPCEGDAHQFVPHDLKRQKDRSEARDDTDGGGWFGVFGRKITGRRPRVLCRCE